MNELGFAITDSLLEQLMFLTTRLVWFSLMFNSFSHTSYISLFIFCQLTSELKSYLSNFCHVYEYVIIHYIHRLPELSSFTLINTFLMQSILQLLVKQLHSKTSVLWGFQAHYFLIIYSPLSFKLLYLFVASGMLWNKERKERKLVIMKSYVRIKCQILKVLCLKRK